MEQQESKRVFRTKRDLRNGLIELLKDNKIEKISVKDICDHTLISKMTFYKHYDGKDDLLKDCIETIADEFDKEIRLKITEEDFRKDLSGAFELYIRSIVERCMDFKNIILSISNTLDFIKIMRKVLVSKISIVLEEFQHLAKEYELNFDVTGMATFLLGGFSFYILNVLKDELSLDQLCSTCRYMTKTFEETLAAKSGQKKPKK